MPRPDFREGDVVLTAAGVGTVLAVVKYSDDPELWELYVRSPGTGVGVVEPADATLVRRP